MEYITDILKRNIIGIVGIFIGLISIIGSAFYVNMSATNCENQLYLCNKKDNSTENSNTDKETVKNKINVDVKGAVKKPGVYELEDGNNILKALELAGGITSKGTTNNINLSKRLTDEMVIYVFTKDEIKKNELKNNIICEVPKCECETITVTECPDINLENSGKPVNSNKISINKASLDELMLLDGVGESKAKAIIEYREKNGGFKSLEEIKNVSGIGDKAYEQIKEKITL